VVSRSSGQCTYRRWRGAARGQGRKRGLEAVEPVGWRRRKGENRERAFGLSVCFLSGLSVC
jgi:hypothetical protein